MAKKKEPINVTPPKNQVLVNTDRIKIMVLFNGDNVICDLQEAVDKEIELPDTQNRIFYTKELEHSDAPKKKGSSYIVKEQGTQIRKKTNPGE